jgi:hypothetical protein
MFNKRLIKFTSIFKSCKPVEIAIQIFVFFLGFSNISLLASYKERSASVAFFVHTAAAKNIKDYCKFIKIYK